VAKKLLTLVQDEMMAYTACPHWTFAPKLMCT